MAQLEATYIVRTDQGGWRVAGSRVSLDSVVRAYWEGESPETIGDMFPTLSLEQIHGAIAFYLREQAEIDAYLLEQDSAWEAVRAESEAKNAPLLRRLRAARQRSARQTAPG